MLHIAGLIFLQQYESVAVFHQKSTHQNWQKCFLGLAPESGIFMVSTPNRFFSIHPKRCNCKLSTQQQNNHPCCALPHVNLMLAICGDVVSKENAEAATKQGVCQGEDWCVLNCWHCCFDLHLLASVLVALCHTTKTRNKTSASTVIEVASNSDALQTFMLRQSCLSHISSRHKCNAQAVSTTAQET